jgi:5,10-methylenetetrahydromethanopterin reductase
MHDPGLSAGAPTFGVAVTGAESWAVVEPRVRALDARRQVTNLWVFDERFERDPWVSMGFMGGATDRLVLGTCVTDALIRHPALTGTAIATLHEATGGRAVLGLGAGLSGFAALGIERKAPATALREAVTFLRQFWTSTDAVEFQGSAFSFHGGRLHHALPAPVPVAIAGRGPRILELAGEVADIALVATFTEGPLLDHALGCLEAGLRRRAASLPELLRAAWVYTSVDEDRQLARDAVRHGIAVALWGSRPLLHSLGIALPDQLATLMDTVDYAATPDIMGRAATLIPDDLIDACSVAGTPDECVERFDRLAARGFRHLALWPFAPDGQDVDDVLDRLVTDVIPRVGRGEPVHQGGSGS